MKIFLSWSGEKSHEVALIFKEWIPSVIQLVEPYVSSEDVNKGSRWSTDIAKELETSTFGIIFVTPENLEAPWIHFEAGALSKVIDKSHVCPFLFGVKRSDVKGPLVQFQSTIYKEEDLKKLIITINSVLKDEALTKERLEKSFNMWWPNLSKKLDEVKEELPELNEPKKKEKKLEIGNNETLGLLEEILELSRFQQRIISSPEELLPPNYLKSIFSDLSKSSKYIGNINIAVVRALKRCLFLAEEIIDKYEKNEEEYIPIEELKKLMEELKRPVKYMARKYNSDRNLFVNELLFSSES